MPAHLEQVEPIKCFRKRSLGTRLHLEQTDITWNRLKHVTNVHLEQVNSDFWGIKRPNEFDLDQMRPPKDKAN